VVAGSSQVPDITHREVWTVALLIVTLGAAHRS
jgi:hypothetical protein